MNTTLQKYHELFHELSSSQDADTALNQLIRAVAHDAVAMHEEGSDLLVNAGLEPMDDSLVEVMVEIADELFLQSAKLAHEQNITWNRLLTNILEEQFARARENP